ncbi:MAG: CoA transferase [Pseudomonadota bacterium]
MSENPQTTTSGPLTGIRVIDLGSMIAGPAAATVLCDQGAEVIKVEPPGIGDVMRYLGASRNGVSSLFHNCNRGKKSLTLNLKQAEAVEILKALVKTADVVLENYRPGVTERLGIDYQTLSALNPDLIYLSVCGFGDTGPLADKAAYDNVIQTFAGVAQSQSDQQTGEPRLYQQLFCDKVTALTGAQAISAALFARERGAGGQHIRLSMADAAVSFLWADVAGARSFEEPDAEQGMQIGRGLRLLRFSDGYGTASPVTDKMFHSFCEAFGIDSSDPQLATVADRNANLEKVMVLLKSVDEQAAAMTTAEAIAALDAADVPCAPAHALADMPEHPQMRAMKSFASINHPVAGRMTEPRNPPRFSATDSAPPRPAAALGEHTIELLKALNVTEDDINALKTQGAIA